MLSNDTWILEQIALSYKHDTDNCLACNMWEWSEEDKRPPQCHKWIKQL